MFFIPSSIVFCVFYSLNLLHLKMRRIPIYSWGTVIAVLHLLAGMLSFLLIPITAILVSATVEIIHSILTPEEKKAINKKYADEIIETEKKIERAREEIDKYRIVKSYTIDNYAEFHLDMKILDRSGVWYTTRSGVLTGIITTEENYIRCCELLQVDPMPRFDA